MKAIVSVGPYSVAVEEVADPIETPLDAVVRITTTTICGSDLHMFEGRTNLEEGTTLGHENMKIVETVGPGVQRVKVGGRVSVPFNISCGMCRNCHDGWWSFCRRVNPNDGVDGAAYGYAKGCNRELRGVIAAGIVSHDFGLSEAVDADDTFDRRCDGRSKVLLHPRWHRVFSGSVPVAAGSPGV